ncbi:MAG: hypothetical protein QM638_00860 [Nocardioides sp.]|uniref:COG4705 family protein n=1 Tax=Nocardioides sp. TaxID=35761 RepID=UPI0039E4A1D8
MQQRAFVSPKVPEVFVVFWATKLLTTGIGETGADFLGSHSIAIAGIVGVGGFFAALWWQLRAETYHPVRYWVSVLMVAVFGTMIADGPHVALGTPYWFDAIVYFALLCGLLAWWYRSEGTLSVHSIVTSRRERLYWGTVLMTFGLGTALGDAAAIDAGLGFGWSIVLFGVAILLPLGLWRAGLPAVGCFWASYALTRPLGASVADFLASRSSAGGLGWGTGVVTAAGLVIFAALVGYVTLTHSDEEGAHARATEPHQPLEPDALPAAD